MSIKIQKSDDHGSFRLNGLLRKKGSYEIEYEGNSLGIRNIYNHVDVINPTHFSNWVNINDESYTDVATLEIDLVSLINTSGGGGALIRLSENDLGLDAWGRPKTITDKSLFSGLFTNNVSIKMWKEIFNGVERPITNATSVNGKLHLLAGANLNDVTVLDSYRNLRYQANRGHLYSTACYIINPTGAMIRDFGTFTEESGTFFRIKDDGVYAVVATTIDTVYSEREEKIDIGILDISKGHTYDIQFEWRGVGDYFFFIDLQLVHTMNFLGTGTELSMFNPSNPVAFRSTNLGDNDAMEFGCVDITSEGGTDPKGEYGSVSMDNEAGQIAIVGFNQPVMAVRSKKIVGGQRNTRDTLALLVSNYADNKCLMRVWATRDFTAITEGTQVWEDFGDGHLEYLVVDPDAVTKATFDVTKAHPAVFGARVGQDTTYASSALFEDRTDVYQTPGDMFIFTQHRENGTGAVVGCTYEFAEEI